MRYLFVFIILICISLNGMAQNKVNSVYFAFDIYKLSAKNKSALMQLIPQLKSGKIILKGYTDFVGDSDYNQKLSEKRVNTVKAFLTSNGVDEKQIVLSSGLGERTEFEQRSANRCVDIMLETEMPKQVVTVEKKKEEPIIEAVEEVKEDKSTLKDDILGLKVGETLAIENLEFLPGRHFLQPYSDNTLLELLHVLESYPKLKIEIQGHICCTYTGEDGLDKDTGLKELSLNRAKYVYIYLVKEGISKDRLSYKGFAATRPLVKEVTKEDQQRNRRVEILILEK